MGSGKGVLAPPGGQPKGLLNPWALSNVSRRTSEPLPVCFGVPLLEMRAFMCDKELAGLNHLTSAVTVSFFSLRQLWNK